LDLGVESVLPNDIPFDKSIPQENKTAVIRRKEVDAGQMKKTVTHFS
jgi:hypothetical protein